MNISTALKCTRSRVCIVFARVASQITALAASEKTIVCAAEEGAAAAVCAVASIDRRGRILESDLFVGSDLGTVEEMLDCFDVDRV